MPRIGMTFPKYLPPPEIMQNGHSNTFLTFLHTQVVCGQFQSCTSVQTNSTLSQHPNPNRLVGSESARAVARLRSVLVVLQPFEISIIAPPRLRPRSITWFFKFDTTTLFITGGRCIAHPLEYIIPGDILFGAPQTLSPRVCHTPRHIWLLYVQS